MSGLRNVLSLILAGLLLGMISVGIVTKVFESYRSLFTRAGSNSVLLDRDVLLHRNKGWIDRSHIKHRLIFLLGELRQ